MAVVTNFQASVDQAYVSLLNSVSIEGPHNTRTHNAYKIRGLAETPEQIQLLSWCILGFLDEVGEVNFKLQSIIGTGPQIAKNLKRDLITYFDIGVDPPPTKESKARKRNPLIAEIVAHVLIHIHRRKALFPHWIGDVVGCRNPHLNVNDGGLDLIALGFINHGYLPVIGEVKAYENDPSRGFSDACKKFTFVREGVYNRELRNALSRLSQERGLSKEDLAKNIWEATSHFGALVSFDEKNAFDMTTHSNSEEVKRQPPERLFLLVSPCVEMEKLFDSISDQLFEIANSFEEQE